MLTTQELRSSTAKELFQELEAARNNMLKVRISIKTKHEKNISKSKQLKCYIAKIMTVMKEIEKEEPSSAKPSSAKATEVPASEAKEKSK